MALSEDMLEAIYDGVSLQLSKPIALQVVSMLRESESLKAECDLAQAKCAAVRQLVDLQALDAGLWFMAQTAPERYLQIALRHLHAEIERKDNPGQPLLDRLKKLERLREVWYGVARLLVLMSTRHSLNQTE